MRLAPWCAMGLFIVAAIENTAITAYAQQTPSPTDRPEAHVNRLDGSLIIDGALEEPAWTTTTDIGPLTRREPQPGDSASERSVVKVLYDRDRLYVGAILYDANPERIVASTMERDAELNGDDRFLVVLDTQIRKTGTTPATNLFAARVSRNLLAQSRVGMIVTNGDPAGLTDNRPVVGDFTCATSRFRGVRIF